MWPLPNLPGIPEMSTGRAASDGSAVPDKCDDLARAITALARFRIPSELLQTAGVRHLTDAQVRGLLGIQGRVGQDLSGIVFPYRDPRDGCTLGHRVRLDIALEGGQKYLSEQGCRHLFFGPICGSELTDVSVPAVIVEAEKSALALCALARRSQLELLVIAAGGVWGWKRKTGIEVQSDGNRQSVSGPSPSLDQISWKDRKTIIIFDSNVAGRRDLEKARLALAGTLSKRGARVLIGSVPQTKGVNGPDDLIAEVGDKAALEMIERAAPFASSNPAPVPGVLASEVKQEQVQWLWENHIPLGKVTIFDGDPDEGKSTVTLDLAARLTRGLKMPDGTTVGGGAAGAVIVSLEDGIADTICPRLQAAGAALDKLRIVQTVKRHNGIEHPPSIPQDLPALESAIRDVNARLLVIDPLLGALGAETNSWNDQHVRRALAPLASLADRTGAAVICIRHLTKGDGQNAKYRGGGSIGIIGAARAAFLFADAPGQEGVHVMAPVKGNLWRKRPAALEYVIEERGGQPVISWRGQSTHSAQSLLAQPASAEESNTLVDARNFLADFLQDGPRDAQLVMQQARRAGVSERTLYRAKAALGIASSKAGIGEGQHWQWELGKIANESLKAANNQSLATFEQVPETRLVTSITSPKVAKFLDLAAFGTVNGNLRGPDTDAIEI